jgi:hypothetical protein
MFGRDAPALGGQPHISYDLFSFSTSGLHRLGCGCCRSRQRGVRSGGEPWGPPTHPLLAHRGAWRRAGRGGSEPPLAVWLAWWLVAGGWWLVAGGWWSPPPPFFLLGFLNWGLGLGAWDFFSRTPELHSNAITRCRDRLGGGWQPFRLPSHAPSPQPPVDRPVDLVAWLVGPQGVLSSGGGGAAHIFRLRARAVARDGCQTGVPAENPDEWGWHRVGMGLAWGWHGVGMGLAWGWHRVSTGLAWG